MIRQTGSQTDRDTQVERQLERRKKQKDGW